MTKHKLSVLMCSCMVAASLSMATVPVKAAENTRVDVITSASTTVDTDSTDNDSTPAKELADGTYTVNYKTLKENDDTTSMAGNYFNSTGAKLTVKDGTYTLRVEYSNSMIQNLRQIINGKEVTLKVNENGENKYVELTYSSINDIALLAMDINTGTSYGVMSHVVRFVLDADSVQEDSTVPVTKITLGQTKATAIVGDKLTLTTTVAPSNATDSSVIWSTSDSSVATVSKKGVVTMKGAGTATITATAGDGSGKKATCKITVKYGISYKLNGGTNNAKNPTSYANEKVTLKAPTKKGYTFVGWFTDKECTKSISSISASSKKNVTVYAKWKKVSVKTASISSLTSTKATKMTASISSLANVDGYQIIYSTSSKFTNTKSTSITSTSKTISGLTSGKKYYVKVRAYKLDSTGAKVYGSYSTVKKVTVK